ncbi:TetR/AcrR family transcriptional regulator [Teredinibacter haidensis]|uniref:TetR/AcrR family transcriptional regulator n=1 Tax=Teredinibacter haidensis TaxID=2731755 RepID=UPI0009489002|nr:TetR/AcrR family transcriptional regulator [Teredinibacter haidensis]
MVKAERHDRQKAIEMATQLFWEKGYHATSMRNLQEFIDLRPGSIYASFGSKEGLFKEVLQYYTASNLARLAACAEVSSPLDALKTFIQRSVIDDSGSAPSHMCMLVKSVSEFTEDNAELLAESKRLLSTVEAAFAALLVQAQASGELDKERDSRRLARFLQAQLMGLRAYVRANDGKVRVNELIDDAFACLH